MTMKQATADPRKRHRTRYPGVYYRIGRDGRRAYLIGFRDEQGRQIWKRVPGDLEAAKDALAEVRRKMGTGEPVRPQARTFGELADEWESIYLAKLRPSTAATYQASLRRYVRPEFGDLPVQRIDARAVAKWISDLQVRSLKAWTIRAALTPLRRILNHRLIAA
jgi:Phage integrase, N-terminal SAM-like domain